MSLKVVEREIDGVELRCTQFESLVALSLLPRVSVLSAYTLKRAKEMGVSGDETLEALLPVVFDVAVGLTSEEMQTLARDTLAATEVKMNGTWVWLKGDKAINLAFAGKLPALFRAILFAVEVNFLSFFAVAQPGKRDPGGAAAEASPVA